MVEALEKKLPQFHCEYQAHGEDEQELKVEPVLRFNFAGYSGLLPKTFPFETVLTTATAVWSFQG
jgi:hypothetical protein